MTENITQDQAKELIDYLADSFDKMENKSMKRLSLVGVTTAAHTIARRYGVKIYVGSEAHENLCQGKTVDGFFKFKDGFLEDGKNNFL